MLYLDIVLLKVTIHYLLLRMKKSNGTLIALLLIAIHAILFFVLIGQSGERAMDEQPGKTPCPIVSEDLSASANRVDPLVAEMTQEIREPASEITPVKWDLHSLFATGSVAG